MQIRRVRREEPALRRFVEECWLPYHRELSTTVSSHSLIDGLEVQEVVANHLDALETPAERLWVGLEDGPAPAASLSGGEGSIAGFVRSRLRPAPEHFEWPDRLEVRDIWVHPSHRDGDLADALMARVKQQAREDGCEELTAVVATENERATAYFDNLGFEVKERGMHVPLTDVTLTACDGQPMTGDHDSVHLRRLRIDATAMDRFLEECWFPFWRALEEAVGTQYLSPDLDRDALIEEHLDAYDVPDRRCWVALDDVADPTASLDAVEGVFAGWLNAGLEPDEPFLDPPERLFIGNLYVNPRYRGSGLADHLVRRSIQYAREEGCRELSLGVEVDNERAVAYYEKLGFVPNRRRLIATTTSVGL